jgi:hypothetical protein
MQVLAGPPTEAVAPLPKKDEHEPAVYEADG